LRQGKRPATTVLGIAGIDLVLPAVPDLKAPSSMYRLDERAGPLEAVGNDRVWSPPWSC
jgi:hypothetical protein